MGGAKEAMFPYYEELCAEFEEKHGREPTSDEDGKLWDKARDRMMDSAMAQADSLRKRNRGE